MCCDDCDCDDCTESTWRPDPKLSTPEFAKHLTELRDFWELVRLDEETYHENENRVLNLRYQLDRANAEIAGLKKALREMEKSTRLDAESFQCLVGFIADAGLDDIPIGCSESSLVIGLIRECRRLRELVREMEADAYVEANND